MQSREFWCFSMHPSHLIISFSCFVYSLHSLLGQSFFIWGSILLGPSAKHMALKEPTNHQIFHQNPRWPMAWKKELGKIFHCIWKPCHVAWSSTLIVPGFPFAWRAECIKGKWPEGSVFGTGTHLDSFDSCPVPFQCIRKASSQKAHGPEIDPQFSSNCDAVNMPWVLLPSCHWMSLWCLQKADRELEGCNHLRQSSQEVLPQNSQFFEDVITACSPLIERFAASTHPLNRNKIGGMTALFQLCFTSLVWVQWSTPQHHQR